MKTEMSYGNQSMPVFLHLPTDKLGSPSGVLAGLHFRQRLLDAFSGFTIAGTVVGSWRDLAGTVHDDFHTVVTVSMQEDQLDHLKNIVSDLAAALTEQCIFVLIGGRCPRTHFWWAHGKNADLALTALQVSCQTTRVSK
jgi:hypothetical protein